MFVVSESHSTYDSFNFSLHVSMEIIILTDKELCSWNATSAVNSVFCFAPV